jgi:hypothetical protein
VEPPPERLEIIAMHAQFELEAKGFYNALLTEGCLPNFHSALRTFQNSQRLIETGSMDNATLSKLGIVH